MGSQRAAREGDRPIEPPVDRVDLQASLVTLRKVDRSYTADGIAQCTVAVGEGRAGDAILPESLMRKNQIRRVRSAGIAGAVDPRIIERNARPADAAWIEFHA